MPKKNAKPIDQEDVRLDFPLGNNQLMTNFSCENKPTDTTEAETQAEVQAKVQADVKKSKELREKRLIYIQFLLPHHQTSSTLKLLAHSSKALNLLFMILK